MSSSHPDFFSTFVAMKKLLFILLFTPFFSFSQEQHDHHGIDEYEVRYIKEQLTTDLALQQTLRNQNAWQNFLTQHPHWFVNFNEYNLKPHRAYGEPIELLIGNSIEDKALQFIQNELSSFNIPISDLYLLDVRENEKYKYLDFKQKYNGLEVHDSRLYIKITQGDELVVFGLDVFFNNTVSYILRTAHFGKNSYKIQFSRYENVWPIFEEISIFRIWEKPIKIISKDERTSNFEKTFLKLSPRFVLINFLYILRTKSNPLARDRFKN